MTAVTALAVTLGSLAPSLSAVPALPSISARQTAQPSQAAPAAYAPASVYSGGPDYDGLHVPSVHVVTGHPAIIPAAPHSSAPTAVAAVPVHGTGSLSKWDPGPPPGPALALRGLGTVEMDATRIACAACGMTRTGSTMCCSNAVRPTAVGPQSVPLTALGINVPRRPQVGPALPLCEYRSHRPRRWARRDGLLKTRLSSCRL
jgi:hypothetical protein